MTNVSAQPRTRLHIVGCHRSGTTLLMELLWHCFEFGGRDAHEVPLFEPIPAGEGAYLTKKPPDTIRIDRVFREDPALYVIAMRRDPRAVITSRHDSRPNDYFRAYHVWEEYERAIAKLEGHPRFLVLNYEALVTDPAAVQVQVQSAFPFLQRSGDFANYPEGADINAGASESLNGVRALDPSRIHGWREHLPRVKSQLLRYPQLGPELIRCGYEPNDDWQQLLDGVTPHQQSYKEQPAHWFKRLETAFRFWRKGARYRKQRGI